MAFMESIRDKFIHDSKESSLLKKDVSQKPMAPLPQDRETAKQDLFNTQSNYSHPSQQSQANHQPAQGLLHSLPISSNFGQATQPGNLLTSFAFGPHLSGLTSTPSQQFTPGMVGPHTDEAATPQQIMEQRVRQHILNAQLHAQQSPQNQQGLPQPMQLSEKSTLSESLKPPTPTQQPEKKSADAEREVEMDEQDEELNPPKPRPPSPEYDDMDGREIHEDNTHLFRVSVVLSPH